MITQIGKDQINIPGGSTGEVLTKNSNANYDYTWAPSGGGGGLQNNLSATTLPGASNDNTQGYSVGSLWFKNPTLGGVGGLYVCADITTNAAIWNRVENTTQVNGTPTVNDDNTLGYATGYLWLDLNGTGLWWCFNAPTGAATWINVIPTAGTVQSVTGLNTDNTDPVNPVVQISVDGVTITGAGTPGSPLVGAAATPPVFTTGTAIRFFDDASGNQVIAHGLGTTPLKVRLTCFTQNSTWLAWTVGNFVATGPNTRSLYNTIDFDTTGNFGSDTSIATVYASGLTADSQRGTVTVDATNITIAWTKGGSGAHIGINMLWEAEA